MTAEILQELLEAIERRDWTEAMTIGRAALEQMRKIEGCAPSCSSREHSGQYFDQTYKAFG
jgi:hypothetical protein